MASSDYSFIFPIYFRPVLPLSGEQKSYSPAEESETFCKAVVHVTTEEEIVRTVKRKIVTEFFSLETGKLLKTKTSEFEQTEAPEKTLNVRSSSPTYEIVSFRSICLDSSEDDRKGWIQISGYVLFHFFSLDIVKSVFASTGKVRVWNFK